MTTFNHCGSRVIFCMAMFGVAAAMQCYTCRGTASNEVDANVRCLAASNLEDCDHFYEYYDLVDTDQAPAPPQYEFPEYGPDTDTDTDPGPSGHGTGVRAAARETPKRHRRVRAANAVSATNASVDGAAADDKYEYEYYDSDTSKVATGTTVTSLSGRKTTNLPKMVKVKEPEHHCYSTTTKTAWESYVVEKGCMRIKYCHDRQAALSEWSKPWNFCCKRSRCNAKLVEDEPQRVFGMGCRRTEDCVQGHNNRPVCSNYFKSCPHISTAIIKMECRLQARRPVVTGRSVVATRQAPQERRCFCVRNAFPKGPICLSAAVRPRRSQHTIAVLLCGWLVGHWLLGRLVNDVL